MLEAAVGVFWLMSKNVKLVCWTSVTVTTFSRTRTGHRQPDQDWICFDGQRWGNRDWLPRDRPERLSRALIAFPMRVDATFNWTELKAKQSTLDWRNVQTQKRSEFSTCFECIQAGLPSTSEFFSDVQRPQKPYRSLGTGGGWGGGVKVWELSSTSRSHSSWAKQTAHVGVHVCVVRPAPRIFSLSQCRWASG